jgi:hypothetical protein
MDALLTPVDSFSSTSPGRHRLKYGTHTVSFHVPRAKANIARTHADKNDLKLKQSVFNKRMHRTITLPTGAMPQHSTPARCKLHSKPYISNTVATVFSALLADLRTGSCSLALHLQRGWFVENLSLQASKMRLL